jgi:hypothetical protein
MPVERHDAPGCVLVRQGLSQWRANASLILPAAIGAARSREEIEMTEYLTVWRAKVVDGDVKPLLDVEPKAIAEAKRLCPDLLGADLVNLGDGTWFHVLRWSAPDGTGRLMARAEEFDLVHTMHGYLADAEEVGHGEVVSRS